MKLESITLAGFKSFAEKTTIPLQAGINAIIGPNGSGKSNVIDAVRWATGGGRAKDFRAEDKTDIIFHGAGNRKTLGYAEVEVRLRDHEKRAVVVTRSIYRDGQTKLRLAGKNARFLDVDEVLADSGLGRRGLAVIGQGEVSGILTASPETLLDYVAQAAGIGQLSQRRDKTQVRLKQAAEQLERVYERVYDVSGQVELLQTEAQQAQEAVRLERTIRQLSYTLAKNRVVDLVGQCKTLQAKEVSAKASLAQQSEQLQAVQAEWEETKAKLEQAESTYHATLAQAETCKGDVRVAQARLEALLNQHHQHQKTLEHLAQDLSSLPSTPPMPPEGDVASLQAQCEQLAQAVASGEADLAPLAREHQAALAAYQKATTEQQAYQQVQHVYEVKFSTALEQLEEARAALGEARAKQEKLAQTCAEHEEKQSQLNIGLITQQQAYNAEKQAWQAAQQARADVAAELLAVRQHGDRLERSYEARQGYARGPKEVFKQAHPAVLGSVADLLTIPPEYRTAITSALGRRLENIVISHADAAQEIVAQVRRVGGYVTLLPLDLIRANSSYSNAKLLAETGVLGMASDLVTVAADYENILAQLLGRTAIIDTLDNAVKLARRYNSRPRFVTLDGNVIEAFGAISGGKAGGAKDDTRVFKQDVQDVLVERKKLEQTLASHDVICTKAKARLDDQKTTLTSIETQIANLKMQQQAAKEALAATTATLQAWQRQHDTVHVTYESLTPPVPPAHDLAQLAERMDQLEQLTSTFQADLASKQQTYVTCQHELNVFQEKMQAYQQASTAFAQAERQRMALEQRQTEVTVNLANLAEQKLQAEKNLETAQANLPDLEPVSKARDLAKSKHSTAQQALQSLSEARASTASQLESSRLDLARKQAALEAAKEVLAPFPEGIALLEGKTSQLKSNLKQAETKRATLGDVNHRAPASLQEAQENLTMLEENAQQASEAVAMLDSALTDLDNTISQRIKTTTAAVNERFLTFVHALFSEDAHAELSLIYSKDAEDNIPQPTGVKLSLQPPNKTTQSLNLLSVGERTMGAMAFLFALMEGEHALPIAILDEVDAPLDEANIRRFRDFLVKLAKQGTQFVLITHQKATMECADVLWGVTTQSGTSRIFSIKKEKSD